jgi:hypothetical protein
VGEVFYANAKLSRGIGLSLITSFQHPSDVRAGTPGTPGSPAFALMREASITKAYRQSREDDARMVCETYRFPPGSEDTLMTLPQGVCLCKIGSRDPFLLEHVRSPQEVRWTDTDGVIQGRAT